MTFCVVLRSCLPPPGFADWTLFFKGGRPRPYNRRIYYSQRPHLRIVTPSSPSPPLKEATITAYTGSEEEEEEEESGLLRDRYGLTRVIRHPFFTALVCVSVGPGGLDVSFLSSQGFPFLPYFFLWRRAACVQCPCAKFNHLFFSQQFRGLSRFPHSFCSSYRRFIPAVFAGSLSCIQTAAER